MRTTTYRGYNLAEVDGVWECTIGGLVHKRLSFDSMRDHLNRIDSMADDWPALVFPVTGRAIPQKMNYIAADLMSAVRAEFPTVNYAGERKVAMSLTLEKMPGSDANLCTVRGLVVT